MLLTQLVIFIFGLVILLVSANLFVSSAVKLAYLLKLSPLIIGVTVMGLGTSLPELAVAIFGSLRKSSGLVAGNIVGSNIANIGMILGVSFILGKIRIGTTKTPVLAVLHLFVTLIFLVLLAYGFLTFSVGLVFLAGMAVVLFWQINAGRKGAKVEDRHLFEKYSKIDMKTGETVQLVILGLVGTFLGGKVLVDSSLNIAKLLGLAPSLIGLTAVAVGTSIPELITNIIGVSKGEEKLVLGNILGTNIINILLIGGVASLFSPLYFVNMVGFLALLGFTFLLSVIVCLYKGRNVGKGWGVVLLLGYVLYLVVLFRTQT